MSLPRYLPAFTLTSSRGARSVRYELSDGSTSLAWAKQTYRSASNGLTFFSDPDRAQPAFSYAVRAPGEFDAFDERGEAIGYFRADHLSAPYLEARARRSGRLLELWDEQYPVLAVESRFGSGRRSVTVPDRRLALVLAAAFVVAIDLRRGR